MSRTTIAITTQTRERLALLMQRTHADSADAMVAQLIFEHECAESLAQLDANPDNLADYRADVAVWVDADQEVPE